MIVSDFKLIRKLLRAKGIHVRDLYIVSMKKPKKIYQPASSPCVMLTICKMLVKKSAWQMR